jgi:hypothetical protein
LKITNSLLKQLIRETLYEDADDLKSKVIRLIPKWLRSGEAREFVRNGKLLVSDVEAAQSLLQAAYSALTLEGSTIHRGTTHDERGTLEKVWNETTPRLRKLKTISGSSDRDILKKAIDHWVGENKTTQAWRDTNFYIETIKPFVDDLDDFGRPPDEDEAPL